MFGAMLGACTNTCPLCGNLAAPFQELDVCGDPGHPSLRREWCAGGSTVLTQELGSSPPFATELTSPHQTGSLVK